MDNQGAAKGKNKAQGGRRIMYTNHTPFWDAKNRYGLPEELPFDYESIRNVIESSTNIAASAIPDIAPAPIPETVHEKPDQVKKKEEAAKEPEPAVTKQPEQVVQKPAKTTDQYKWEPVPAEKLEKELDMQIPKRLRDLMVVSGVTDWDIQNICEAKGYVPYGTLLKDYDQVNPPLIDAGIIAHWDSVVSQIKDMYEKQEIPFLEKESK